MYVKMAYLCACIISRYMNVNRHRVLFLSSWYPNRLNPTDGNFNEKFAEAAAIYNEVVAMHVVADPDASAPFEADNFTKAGVKTHILYFRKSNGKVGKLINGFLYVKYYLKSFRQLKKEWGKPDIIHLNVVFPSGAIALLFKWLFGLKYVISEHWTGYLPDNQIQESKLVRALRRIVARNAEVIMPVTHNLKEAMVRKGLKNHYRVIPNVVDVKYFFPLKENKKTEKKTILHVSHLNDEHKNVSGILRVIRKLSALRNDFTLKIVGDGDLSPHIEYASKLKIDNDWVSFYGTMSTQEIARTMQNADLFVLFSNYENLPCVIIEAFAAGLPVISTDVGGIKEHLTPDKGVLIAPLDEPALLNAINKLLDSSDAYNSEQLHKYAAENFSYETIGNSFTQIYTTVITRQKLV